MFRNLYYCFTLVSSFCIMSLSFLKPSPSFPFSAFKLLILYYSPLYCFYLLIVLISLPGFCSYSRSYTHIWIVRTHRWQRTCNLSLSSWIFTSPDINVPSYFPHLPANFTIHKHTPTFLYHFIYLWTLTLSSYLGYHPWYLSE